MTAQIHRKTMQRYLRTVCYLYTMALDVWFMTLKHKFIPLGYTKYIALEPNPDLRKITAEANSSIPQTEDTAAFPGIQHHLLGAHSPAELAEWHIRRIPSNSIKLFTSD